MIDPEFLAKQVRRITGELNALSAQAAPEKITIQIIATDAGDENQERTWFEAKVTKEF